MQDFVFMETAKLRLENRQRGIKNNEKKFVKTDNFILCHFTHCFI